MHESRLPVKISLAKIGITCINDQPLEQMLQEGSGVSPGSAGVSAGT